MWTDKEEFLKKIRDRTVGISVVGLGYVGLNIACTFVKNGFSVYGFDVDEKRIKKIKNGINPIPEEEWLGHFVSKLKVFTDIELSTKYGDVVFVAVPTPFRNGETDLNYLFSALMSMSKNLSRGKIIVIESTVPNGTTEKFVKDIIEKETSLKAVEDFGLASSPERIDPGNKKNMVWNIPKIVGGVDLLSTEIIAFLYSQTLEKVITVSNPRTAEFVKAMENTQRDVNIALINLFAKTADKLKIDIEEALDAASTKWNFLRFKPGCGVGGECIGDAASMLVEVMEKVGVDSALINESRRINESMPGFTIEKLREVSEESEINLKDLKIGILGLSYKGNSSDIRNSPALRIIEKLVELGCKDIIVYDPFVLNEIHHEVLRAKSLEEVLENRDCIIIATDHDEFKNINVTVFKKCGIKAIIDGRNCLNKGILKSLEIVYKGIGR